MGFLFYKGIGLGIGLKTKRILLHIPMKLTTLNRCKLTSQSGGEKVSFLAAVIIQI
jgi:hypothetical protein